MTDHEYFPEIKQIKYNPDADKKEVLVFRHYNKDEKVMGKTMEEWLKFSICFWHTFNWTGQDTFGTSTQTRPKILTSEDKLKMAFEFFTKLGIKYWTFHDRDIASEGSSLDETNKNLDKSVELAKELQDKTGIKLLWGTANLFSNKRYMNGASTNPDQHVFAYAGAQVKKALEITKYLGGENYVFWGGREGFSSYLNTNIGLELNNMAKFLKMAADYKEKIGFKGQLLIEPKPKEPTKHQYDYDAQTVIGFLSLMGLKDHYKLNIEPNHTTMAGHSYEHDLILASTFDMLGSIDANTGDSSLGWDTDQFPTDLKNAVMTVKTIVEQNGLSGGLNFDCKVRRESTDIEDLFIGHIGAMDLYAKALKIVAKMKEDDVLDSMVKNRYNYDSVKELKSFEECEELINKIGEPMASSGKQEKYEMIFNNYLY